jgi:hypothetical protein
MGGFLIFSPFYLVQDLVSLVDPRANLLLPSKARRVFEIPDDASILEMQLRREINSPRPPNTELWRERVAIRPSAWTPADAVTSHEG